MNEQKMTFNYLLSHRVMPQIFFGDLDFFYRHVITSPSGLQTYMKYAMERAAAIAGNDPDDIEPPFDADEFNIGILGEIPERGVVVIVIPNCGALNDCGLIAIPCMRAHARYFTCELSCDPLSGVRYFILGEWKANGGGGFTHTNYGQVDPDVEVIVKKLVELVYETDDMCAKELDELYKRSFGMDEEAYRQQAMKILNKKYTS